MSEEIDDAMKNGSVDAARKHRKVLEPEACLPSVWGNRRAATALWNAYDLGRWADGVIGVTARAAIDAVGAVIGILNEMQSDPFENLDAT